MKIVLDTNVIMSGLFFGGVPAEILSAWGRGTITIVVTGAILEEYWATGAKLAERFPPVSLPPYIFSGRASEQDALQSIQPADLQASIRPERATMYRSKSQAVLAEVCPAMALFGLLKAP